MSRRVSLFVIVEGRHHDRYFVQRLCEASSDLTTKGYEIRTVGQVLGDTSAGGKTAALAIFSHAKAASRLTQHNSRGVRSLAFILDRDAEHITGGRKRSPHIIYTSHADGEAQAFHTSNEVDAIANAASMDRASAEALIRQLGDWKKRLANDWRAWIELCYVAEATRARCWVGFSHENSKIHSGQVVKTVKTDALKSAEAALKSTSPLNETQFEHRRQVILAKIDSVYRAGTQSTLLNGKWLPRQLATLVSHACNKHGYTWHGDGFRESVSRCYLAHMNPRRPENGRITRRLELLVSSP